MRMSKELQSKRALVAMCVRETYQAPQHESHDSINKMGTVPVGTAVGHTLDCALY